MNIEELREYCLQKNGVEESFPFGSETLVFKVGGKIFLLTGISEHTFFNAKCNPERVIELREQYEEVKPAYHMNKKHWNSVYTNGNLSNKVMCEIIDHSYELVCNGLTKKEKEKLAKAKR